MAERFTFFFCNFFVILLNGKQIYYQSVKRIQLHSTKLSGSFIFSKVQGGARNVIPLIVHVTNFYYYKNF